MSALFRVEQNVAPAAARDAQWMLFRGGMLVAAANDLCVAKRINGGDWRVMPEPEPTEWR